MKKQKIIVLMLCMVLVFNAVFLSVNAIEYNPTQSGDDETNKEYTASLIDLQIDTVMPLGGELYDDEFGIGTTDDVELSLTGAVKINKKIDEENVEYLNEMPQVSLVDSNGNVVATTDIYCESDISSEPSDIYYISFYDLDITDTEEYKIQVSINDEETTVTKYLTYSGDLVYNLGTKVNMTYESINNILCITFSDIAETIIQGDLDGNGVVNTNDAAYALDLFKYENATEEDIKVGDIDGNGVINANDAALILDIYKYGN